MKVVVKYPGCQPNIREIDGSLESLQDIVGGWIEHVGIRKGLGMIINEEGKLHGLPENFAFRGDMIVGPAIFVGEAGEDFTDVPEDFLEFNSDFSEDMEVLKAILKLR